MEQQTANVYELNIASGEERRLTSYTGDVQISSLNWDTEGDRLAIAVFDADGNRDIHIYSSNDQRVEPLVASPYDDRDPMWSPDGRHLAFTSFRDAVPNAYVLELEEDTVRTVTRLATGARVRDWLPPDEVHSLGRLVVVSGVSKQRDRVFAVDAERDVGHHQVDVPEEYVRWTVHRPPHELPSRIEPDPTLIQNRGRYNSWRNITHAASLALPYYTGQSRWGVFGLTSFVEPLGKHAFAGIGALSIGDLGRSWFAASYINNQWYPTVTASVYRFPGSVQVYGSEVLAERYSGGDVMMRLPLAWRQRPFTSTEIGLRGRFIAFEPIREGDLNLDDGLPAPQSGEQFDVQLEFSRRTLRPYRHNIIHPLDGHGIQLRLTAAAPILGTDLRFVEGDVRAYVVLPSIGRHRLFFYGRAQAREGTARPQDYIGLSRYDDVLLALPGQIAIELGGRERVRGYNAHVIGDGLLFGSAEYRVPLLPSLQTRLLGLISLGATTGAVFADAAMVWSGRDFDAADRRVGVGAEVKNALRFGGLEIAHSAGVAQPVRALGHDEPLDVYYRIRAAIPF